MQPPETSIQFFNESELAALIGVSVKTLRRWRMLNRGPKYLKLGALIRYKRDDLLSWLASRPSGGEQKAC